MLSGLCAVIIHSVVNSGSNCLLENFSFIKIIILLRRLLFWFIISIKRYERIFMNTFIRQKSDRKVKNNRQMY